MSSLAQEESRSISENVRWGQRKKAADGKYSLNYKHFLGYDKGEDGTLVVNEEQAKIVRRIFGEFLAGNSAFQIAKNLTEDGIPTPAGKKKWHYSTVRSILSNETYMGDKLLQKTYTIDFLSKDRLKNTGQVPQYYVEQDHAELSLQRLSGGFRTNWREEGMDIPQEGRSFPGGSTAANVARSTDPKSGIVMIHTGRLCGSAMTSSRGRSVQHQH